MTTSAVWLLGGYQTDFARNFSREGLDFADLTGEVVRHTLESARVGAGDIGVVHVGNAFGELFTGQGHLGAMPATVCADLWGVPAIRHEAACASGGARRDRRPALGGLRERAGRRCRVGKDGAGGHRDALSRCRGVDRA